MDIKKPQLVKVEAFAVFLRNSSATPSFLATIVYKLSAFGCFATPSVIVRGGLFQLSRPIIGVLPDAIIVLCHLSGHTSAALRCTVTIKSASYGRPCGILSGMRGVCAVADARGINL